jgi:DtxR family Mn-dependent transcriptional regulator
MVDPLSSLLVAVALLGAGYWLLRPGEGVIPKWRSMRKITDRVLREDALKHIQKLAYRGKRPTLHSVAGALNVSADRAAQVLSDLEHRRLVCMQAGEWCLTPDGEAVAFQVIRAHRLWERFLAEQTGYSEEEWHVQAENLEHTLTAEEIEELARSLHYPSHDPHGDPIPTADGELLEEQGIPLTKLDLNQSARIIHIPDEPEVVAAQIIAEGFKPGMVVRIIDVSNLRVTLWSGGEEHVLAPVVANEIAVVPLPEEVPQQEISGDPLTTLRPGQRGEVVMLSPHCRGPERRRLMDLGILPGTVIKAELVSPGGDPTAYRIRDALIALRKEQAEWIRVELLVTEDLL